MTQSSMPRVDGAALATVYETDASLFLPLSVGNSRERALLAEMRRHVDERTMHPKIASE